uniref:thioredoxin family protein n=1 Tax=Roseateles sp. TaxID=1971397 RepID=UPI00286AABCC
GGQAAPAVCGPCKMIAPILGEIAAEQGDHLIIAKLNVDENPEIAMRYNVMSIPTLLIFNGGEVRKRLVGAKGKGQPRRSRCCSAPRTA